MRRALTVVAILLCIGLAMSLDFNIFHKKAQEPEEDPSTLKRMAGQFADYFTHQKDKDELDPSVKEGIDALKADSWFEKVKHAAKASAHIGSKNEDDKDKKDKDEDEEKKSLSDKLKFWKKDEDEKDKKDKDAASKDKDEDKDKESWSDKLKFWKKDEEEKDKDLSDKEKKEKKEKEEKAKKDKKGDEKEDKAGWLGSFKFWGKDKIEDKIDAGADAVTKRTHEMNKKIYKAVHKKHKGIEKIMDKTGELKLPKLEFPDAIKDIKPEDANLKECAHYLKPALPHLMKFGYHASRDHSHRAVSQLFDVLQYLPNISKNCVGQEFKLSENKADNKKCVKDITELTELVANLAKHPLHVIGEVKRMKALTKLVPQCVGHCTTAFEEGHDDDL